jgi:hypothetical protein
MNFTTTNDEMKIINTEVIVNKDMGFIIISETWNIPSKGNRIYQHVVDLKEECVRSALIELGWTPPKEGEKQ